MMTGGPLPSGVRPCGPGATTDDWGQTLRTPVAPGAAVWAPSHRAPSPWAYAPLCVAHLSADSVTRRQ